MTWTHNLGVAATSTFQRLGLDLWQLHCYNRLLTAWFNLIYFVAIIWPVWFDQYNHQMYWLVQIKKKIAISFSNLYLIIKSKRTYFLFFFSLFFLERHWNITIYEDLLPYKHRKANQKINCIKQWSHFIHCSPVHKFIIWELHICKKN